MGEACLYDRSIPAIPHLSKEQSAGEEDGLCWYALKVRTGRELAVVAALADRGIVSYCPTQKESRQYSDRVKVAVAPLFPGYVFCSFDLQKKVPVISTPGVDYIVSCAGHPAAIPEQELLDIQKLVQAGGTALPGLVSGQRIRVTHGPLQGVEGILVRDGKDHRLVVSIELLNRSASLHISQSDLCLVASGMPARNGQAA